MARLTRNSYKRKIIMFGLFVFVSVALISTGFAAWVMSTNAQVDQSGNVNVGLVEDSSLKIELTNTTSLENFTFYFEPAEGDNTGRVRLDSEHPELHEQLTYTITGKITNYSILSKLTIDMLLPDSIKQAVTLGYIVLPDCANATEEIPVNPADGTFEYTLEFKWGATFGNMNPSKYYDDDATGKLVDANTVKTNLENLRACAYGYYDALTADGADRDAVIEDNEGKEMPKFTVTIIAYAN